MSDNFGRCLIYYLFMYDLFYLTKLPRSPSINFRKEGGTIAFVFGKGKKHFLIPYFLLAEMLYLVFTLFPCVNLSTQLMLLMNYMLNFDIPMKIK